jgi:4-amino-4-deoxy-L-arabinose transferase-like glycosyltransferase
MGPKPIPVPRPTPDSRAPGIARPLLIASLLGLLALQVTLTSLQTSPAFDEVGLLPAGYLYLKTGLWRLVPEHPPLIPALSALPLLPLEPSLDLTDPRRLRDPEGLAVFGADFLFGNDADRLMFWGRLPVLLLSLLLGYTVYRWARDLYGDWAGLMALTLYACCPTIVAHSGFVSHDVGVACFYTLALYWLWRFLREGTWRHLLSTGILLGCALASKATAIVLLPIFVALVALAAWRGPSLTSGAHGAGAPTARFSFPLLAATREGRLRLSLTAVALMFVVAYGVLYLAYGLPSDPLFYVRTVMAVQRLHPPTYPHFLMGQFRVEGWWYYFLVAYAIKTPIPMLLLIPLAVWQWRRQRQGWFDELFLLLPALAYFTLISALASPIGIRYLLPAYPLLFVFVSRTATLFARNAGWSTVGIVLAIWYLSTPIRIYPDYLAYFNELVGGPKYGTEYLDDSNLDWGQNLKRLKRYLDARQFDRVKLLYLGTGRPDYYGIEARPMQFGELAWRPEPGIYVISAHALVRARAYFKTDWLKQHELLDVVGYSFYIFKIR